MSVPNPEITTTPSTPPLFQPSHRKRGSIASPIAPLLDPSHRRTLSSSSTPQHTSPMPIPHVSVSADPLVHPQIFIAGIVSTIILTGIMYSLIFDTAIDTSVSSLIPQRSAYLARKENILNQLFVKKSWGWTSLAFIAHFVSSPPSSSSRKQRLIAFLLATASWVAFSSWFFGPSLNHRLISFSGGRCAVSIPKDRISIGQLAHLAPREQPPVKWGDHVFLPVPERFCYGGLDLTPKNHPGLFETLAQVGEGVGSLGAGKGEMGRLVGKARFHAGFDISGHTFLLTLSCLILAKELAPSWRVLFGGAKARTAPKGGRVVPVKTSRAAGNKPAAQDGPVPIDEATGSLGRGGSFNAYATVFGTALIGLWSFMLGATAVYFHNPPEKLTGLILALAVAGLISLVTPTNTSLLNSLDKTTESASALLESAFIGEDENSARRGSSGDEGGEEVMDDKKTQ